MARQAKPYEEARKDVEAFFRGDSLRTEVFLSRYALRALDGNWLETTPDGHEHRRATPPGGARADRRRGKFRFREFHGSLLDGQPAPGDTFVGSRSPVPEGLGVWMQGDHGVPGGNPRVCP